MNNVLLFLLSCQLLQLKFVFAQITYEDTNINPNTKTNTNPNTKTNTNINPNTNAKVALSKASTAAVNQQECECYPGLVCPAGTVGGIDIRIVNQQGCPSGYVVCCIDEDDDTYPCGVPKFESTAQPVGEADYGAYPWMVLILTTNDRYVGGGVLISPTHVLTVAHKVASYVNGGIKVRLGDWNVQNADEPYSHVDISVSRVTLHSQFNSQNFQNDIAILKLGSAAPVATHRNINPVCLPTAVPSEGTRCWVTGWGAEAFGSNTYASILKEADVPLWSQATCQVLLRETRLGENFVLDKSFICAGGEKGKDACTGDGGSPLVCLNNGAYQVIGLVTWGIGCADDEVPGVYTFVPNFLSWISQTAT